jgi:hypothetical protein
MYQPEIREGNIRKLYRLKLATKKPMTKLINAILEAFFNQLEEFKERGVDGMIESRGAQIRIGNIQLSFLNKDADQDAGGTENKSLEKPCNIRNKGIPYGAQDKERMKRQRG